MASEATSAGRINWLSVGLWAVQIVLALLYAGAGFMKLTQPLDVLATDMTFVLVFPEWFTRFIGLAEVLAAIGLIAPAATRVMPVLTPLAAVGLMVVQLAAMVYHASQGELYMLPVNAVLLALALFIVWGRMKAVPIAAR